jgi:cobalt-zinc-cadmium efflux system outer membrane protein
MSEMVAAKAARTCRFCASDPLTSASGSPFARYGRCSEWSMRRDLQLVRLVTSLVVVALLVLTRATSGRADGTAGPLVVQRTDALRMGAAHGPGVALADAPRGAAVEARGVSRSLPRPPVITLAGGYRAGALTPGVELGVTVSQDVALRRLGRERARTADATTRVIDADVTRARLDAASRAALAWADALEAKELLRLRSEALAQAKAILETTRARVEGGVGQPYELALARGEVGSAEAGLLDAEGMQVEALAELRFALGLGPTAPVTVAGDLYATDEQAIDEGLAVRAAESSHPALRLANARAALADQEVRLTTAVLGPTLSVGGTYVREGTGDHVVTAFVGVPIPFFDAAAFDAARQRGAYRTAEAQVERVRAETSRDVRVALHDHEHWRELRDALSAKALAPMKEAVRLARVHYEVGTAEISLVLLARQRLLLTEEQLARVAAQVQRADIHLGHASGSLLGGGSP